MCASEVKYHLQILNKTNIINISIIHIREYDSEININGLYD